MINRIVAITVLSLSFMACGGSDTENEAVAAVTDGNYSVVVTAQTEFATDGGTCGGASGTFTLTDGFINGTALSNNGFVFVINGDVDDAGTVDGGFAVSGDTVATYTGTFLETSASGGWSEATGCSGVWEAQLTM